jgi:NADPH-dependent 2,4-dienoyl-CoA reductase/sulfur reductase-like enzyme
VSVAVVGAGLAGLRLCEHLRRDGYDDRITLIGEERHPPYSRPPLSKEVLRGDAEPSSAVLRDPAGLAELGLDLRLGTRAVSLSVPDLTVTTDDGESVTADHVVLACGAAPAALPTVDGTNVFLLRTLDDSLRLRTALQGGGRRLVIVGAGFIGLEVAASAVALGCDVTVVDVFAEPLMRVLDPELGEAIRRVHEEHGVQFRLGGGVSGVTTSGGVVGGVVDAVLLDGGEVLPADVVVVAIGVRPATGWLADSGLGIDNGVVCNASLAAAPGVWAVGDVARWPHPPHAASGRVEHWTNAVEQAGHVATAIASDHHAAFRPVPYFWSDQYDAKLQSLGSGSGDETRIVAGSLESGKWTALVRGGERVVGVVGLRSPGQVMKRRQLLVAEVPWADAVGVA